jgi:hypothetical protein
MAGEQGIGNWRRQQQYKAAREKVIKQTGGNVESLKTDTKILGGVNQAIQQAQEAQAEVEAAPEPTPTPEISKAPDTREPGEKMTAARNAVKLYTPVKLEDGGWVAAPMSLQGTPSRRLQNLPQFDSKEEAIQAAQSQMEEENTEIPPQLFEMLRTIAVLEDKKELANIRGEAFASMKGALQDETTSAEVKQTIKDAAAEANDIRETIRNLRNAVQQYYRDNPTAPAPGFAQPSPEISIEPEQVVSRAAERVQEEAIAKDLTESLGDLPTYERMSMEEQADMAHAEIQRDYENAKKMAYGQVQTPEGLRPASIYRAVALKAQEDGDVETLRNLAVVHPRIAEELTALGQAIKAADVGIEGDPVKAIQSVAKRREQIVSKRKKIKDIPARKRSMAKAAKKEVRKRTTKRQNWNEFVDSIRC